MDELRSAVRELVTAPSAEQADVFVHWLRRTRPSPELATFINETLELPALHQVVDSTGTTVRWRLIDRLLAIGFPHALNVVPEDLDYYRASFGRRGGVPAAFAVLASFLSILWCFGLTLAGLVPMAALGVLSVVAFVSALRSSRGEHAPALAKLGWGALAYPAIALGASVLGGNDAETVVLILGAPPLLAALFCALTAAVSGRVAPPPPVELEFPLPERGEGQGEGLSAAGGLKVATSSKTSR